MRVLIIGCSGQVGSEIQRELLNSLAFEPYDFEILCATRKELDLSENNTIPDFLESRSPNFIINATAYTAVDKSESEEMLAFNINNSAVGEMAKYCNRNQSKMLHISTDYVFDGNGKMPYKESDAVGPIGVYGRSKLAGENTIREVLDQHIILRTSWVFGVNGTNFVKTMLELSRLKNELSVVADQFGGPTSARAIAQAIARIIIYLAKNEEANHWGTYHFSGYPFVSWFEFAKEVFDRAISIGLIDNQPIVKPIGSLEYPSPAARPKNSRLDCSKLKNIFGIEPDDWKGSLSLMLDELKWER